MRRIGIILVFCTFVASGGFAASRTSGTLTQNTNLLRQGTTTQRVRTTTSNNQKATRISAKKTTSRAATTKTNNATRGTKSRTATSTPRTANVVARATTETRTGTEYENCKTAYFTCMDQFCQLKNDDFRRCSCSDRITKLQSAKDSLNDAREQLTAFNENLDIVGKTAAQAAAMNTASDGENALTKDNSASKALLSAIMNSIRGDDTHVEHSQLSDLNSVDLSFDSANSFGTTDVGQAIASYIGTALYSAVYPQCRNAVKSTCNDASLQRAVNAYLMAIEQDCNTVQTAIQNKQKETHAAIRESSAMLDMARAENHQKHNSDDIATCIANVETAILSEEVCGTNYHKCLDNGEYIDVTTGAPIAGVIDFYKLGKLLTFNADRNNADQKLAQNPANRDFVTTFEKRVKQFAEPALDKCYDDSKTVWNDYLNKAMLDIYYAQQSKVEEIKQGCFDFVSACYMNGSTAMTNAMQGLVAAQTTTLNPNVLNLNQSLCADYIASCNNMFDGKIIENYISNRHNTDSLTACRAVVKQCFDNYGGLNYENFYNPYSGLFKTGHAPDWFSLYKIGTNGQPMTDTDGELILVSECAKQLKSIEACSKQEMIEKAFGGFDYYPNEESGIYHRYGYTNNDRNGRQDRILRSTGIATEVYNQIIDILQTQCSTLDGKFMNVQNLALYSSTYSKNNFCQEIFPTSGSRYITLYEPYSTTRLVTTYSWRSLFYGRSATNKKARPSVYGDSGGLTPSGGGASMGGNNGSEPFVTVLKDINDTDPTEEPLGRWVNPSQTIYYNENMCPRDYSKTIDTESWGACLCWENGGRRSNNGTSTRCVPTFPVRPLVTYDVTAINEEEFTAQQTKSYGLNFACSTNTFVTAINQDPNLTTTDSQNTPIAVPLNKPLKADSTFVLWNLNIANSSDRPTEQDWCTAEVNSKNQVCPFGVSAVTSQTRNNNQGLNIGDCAYCKFDWKIQSCPSGYTQDQTNPSKCINDSNSATIQYRKCCPNGYTLNTSNKCEKDSDIQDPAKTSSEIMGDNFPESGAEINISNE